MRQLIKDNFHSFTLHLLIGFFAPLALITRLFEGEEVVNSLYIVGVVSALAMVMWHHEATHAPAEA